MVKRNKGKSVKKEKLISKVKSSSLPFRRKTPLKSISKAEKTSTLLEQDFKHAKTREEQVQIKRKVILAANRADKKGKKRRISQAEKKEYEKIAKIYRNSYQRMVLEEIWSEPEQPAIYI